MKTTDFGACCHDRFIHVSDGRIQLAPTLLLTNEMGVCGELEESLSASAWLTAVSHARVAHDLVGGAVDASQLSIGGQLVVEMYFSCRAFIIHMQDIFLKPARCSTKVFSVGTELVHDAAQDAHAIVIRVLAYELFLGF